MKSLLKPTILSISVLAFLLLFLPGYNQSNLVRTARATTPGKFTDVSLSASSTVNGAENILTIAFTTASDLSGNGVIRFNWQNLGDTYSASLDSMTVDSSPFTGYWQTYPSYSYFEIYLDTAIPAESDIEVIISGITNMEYVGQQWVSLVSFDEGGDAYEDCTDAGGGDDYYGACTPFRILVPHGTPEVTARLYGPTGSPDENLGIPLTYVNIWSGSYWDSCVSDHLGRIYLDELQTGTYEMDFWNSSSDITYANPDNQTISVTKDSITDMGIIRFQLPSVTGTVKRADNNQPINGANVFFMNVPMPGESSNDDGSFYLPHVDPGTYYVSIDVYGVVDGGSLVSPDPISVTVTVGSTTDVGTIYIETANKTISGTVKYPDGSPVSNAQIGCNKPMGGGAFMSTQTQANGNYELLVGTGSWNCFVEHDWNYQGDFDWVYFEMPSIVSFNQPNAVVETKTLNYTVTEVNSTIKGKILKPNGAVYENWINVDIFNMSGFGNWAQTDQTTGVFSVMVPPGTYQVSANIWDYNAQWGGPSSQTITVADNETYNMGTLYLVPKSARISGTVTDESGNALNNQHVDCYVPSEFNKWASGSTDANGEYSFRAFGGYSYTCMTMADFGGYGGDSDETYIYLGAPVTANLPNSNSTATNVDFEMTRADATINVTTVDNDGDQLNVWGFAYIGGAGGGMGGSMMMGPGMGGPIDNGSGEFKVPSSLCTASSPCTVNVSTPPGGGSDYTSDGGVEFIAVANGTTEVEILMVPNNATIAGHIVDGDGNTITGVQAFIFADNFSKMAFTDTRVNSEDGSYSMTVAPGSWNLGYFVDPSLGYVIGGSSAKVTAINDQTVTKNLTLQKIDAYIEVTILAPNGNPLSGAFVDASTSAGGMSNIIESGPGGPGMMMGPGPMMGPGMMGEMTGSNGTVTVGVPSGSTYYVSSNLPPDFGYISPPKETITGIESGDTIELTMQFRESDATVSGSVTIDGSPTSAYVSAWAESGGFTEAFAFGGSYSLNVTQDDNWHINAKAKVGSDFYKSGEKVLSVDAALETLDLKLSLAASNVPDPVTATSTAGNQIIVSLEDGMTVNAPAGAFSSTQDDSITLTVTPSVEGAKDTDSAQTTSYTYDIVVLKNGAEVQSNFNSNVTVSLPYNEDQIEDLGITENDLGSSYWNEDSGNWNGNSNAVVNTDEDVITISTNHFTNFAVTSGDISAPSLSVTSPENNITLSVNSVIFEGTVTDANASVAIALDGASTGTIAVDTDGSFSHTVTGLAIGENVITVDASNGAGDAATVTRTITYTTSRDGGDDGTGEDGEITTVATGIDLDLLVNATNGSTHLQAFDNQGNLKATFFAYASHIRTDMQITTADIDGDGTREIIAVPGAGHGPHVRIFTNTGEFKDHFFAYDTAYRGGLKVLTADINGDYIADIVTQPLGQGGPNIRAYTWNGAEANFELIDWFLAYEETFRGDLNLVTSDVTGDGQTDIILAPRENGGPNVRVYTYNNTTGAIELVDWFMAFQEGFRGGVNIGTADVTGDGQKDIVVSPLSNGGPNVRAYQYITASESFELVGWFNAFTEVYRGGVNLKLVDVNNDDISEIVTTATNGSSNVRIYTYNSTTEEFELLDWFMAYSDEYRGGLTVSATDVDGDGNVEIVTTPNEGDPNIRLYEYNTTTETFEVLDWFMAYTNTFRGGVNVKVTDIDGDGDSDIITTPASIGGPNVRIYKYDTAAEEVLADVWFMAFSSNLRTGYKINTLE
ncbi:VCBS repeat-containing protein [Patescibacteria group bacterium]|nr:VCBS repeat-containing protein [Patescibacteria group bacterium]MBU1890468.1 VCBS repeat-containing protein [Patescibacteria group bacterium]